MNSERPRVQTGPFLELPDARKEEKRRAVQARLDALDAESKPLREQLMAGFEAWQETALASAGEIHALDVAEFDSAARRLKLGASRRPVPSSITSIFSSIDRSSAALVSS